jgi:hypothetical protein
MAVESVGNNVSYVNEKKSKHVIPNMLTGAVLGGVPAYFWLKDPIKAGQVLELNQDTFTKTFEKVPEAQKPIVTEIAKEVSEATNKEYINDIIKDAFGDAKTVSVEDYLKHTDYGSKDVLEKALKDVNGKTTELTNAHKAAVDALSKADDAGRVAAQQALDGAKSQLDAHLEEVTKLNINQEVINSAKDGKTITREAIEAGVLKSSKLGAESGIDKKLAELGEAAPKVKNWKTGAKYAAIGAAVFGLGAIIFGGGHKKPAEAPAPPEEIQA